MGGCGKGVVDIGGLGSNIRRGGRIVAGRSRFRGAGGEVGISDISNEQSEEQYDTSSRRGRTVSEASKPQGNSRTITTGIRQPVVAQPRSTVGAANASGTIAGRGKQTGNTQRVTLDEFEFGNRMMEVSNSIRNGVQGIRERLGQEGVGVEDLKVITMEGLNTMMEAVEAVMSTLGDAIQEERRRHEELESKREERVIRCETKIEESKVELEAVRATRDRLARKESIQDMQDKIRLANRQLKFVDIDFGRQTNSKREIVQKTISYMREDVNLSDRKRFDMLLRRTKFVVLGKGTVVRKVEDQMIHNVPVLLEARTEVDKTELEDILRSVNWYSVYHWPVECVEFIKEARNVVRGLGHQDQQCYVKIRPEEREGRMQIKAEVKEKRQGARFRMVAVWEVPPVDKAMWGTGLMHYKTFGEREVRK